MKKTGIFCIIISVINLILLSGCWNYREIEDIAIVAGIAVDKGDEGNYFLTMELIDFEGSGNNSKIESSKIESQGKSIFDAVRNAIKISANRLFWSHAEVLIVSKEVAREGILQIIDFIARDAEPRLQINVLVSKEKTAKELLEQQSILTDIRSHEMSIMINSMKRSLPKSNGVKVMDIINILGAEGESLTLPSIEVVLNQGEPTAELGGMAIFKKDKLIGFLSEEDTRSLMFVKNKIKGGLITFKKDSTKHHDITLEILQSKTKVKPLYLNDKVTMKIDINTQVSIGELGTTNNLLDQKGIEELEEDAGNVLETEISKTIKKVQSDYGEDIFGFGSTIKKQKPSLWKKIGGDWDYEFKKLKVEIKANIVIKESATISKPVKIN